jgi:3-hydroxymyristoyl/3-hydroxydecanoyl-(acyl carrier protein) dehydratase
MTLPNISSEKTLNQQDIATYILHRHENLLLDTITNESLTLKISDNDLLNRHFFKTTYHNNTAQLLSTISMEILALAGIVSSGKTPAGKMVVFAGILNVSLYAPLPFNQPISGTVKKISDKGGFIKYAGELSSNETQLASGQMLAFIADENATNTAPKPIENCPNIQSGTPVEKKPDHKHPELYMIDQYISGNETSCLTQYTYPSTHPLTRGHFPQNPIMMGVLQWATVEDACREYASRYYPNQSITLTGNAIIFKADATLVAEVKQFEVSIFGETSTVAFITKTKRISYRQMIRPNDTIFTHLTELTAI